MSDQKGKDKKIIRVGVIGFGFRNFGMFTLTQKFDAENIILHAICDPNEKSKGIAKIINENIKVYENYDDLCKDPEIDWVFIGSWNNFHRV
jgi:predicted dehydrogenase